MELVPVKIDRVIGNPKQEFAVVLRAPEKAFLIFVGEQEAVTIFREMKGVKVQRPMPHDLVVNVMAAFDISVRAIVISSIVQSIFCATLLLQRGGGAGPGGSREEVRLDLRASDAMILALKRGQDLHVSREVLFQVEDVSAQLADADEFGSESNPVEDDDDGE